MTNFAVQPFCVHRMWAPNLRSSNCVHPHSELCVHWAPNNGPPIYAQQWAPIMGVLWLPIYAFRWLSKMGAQYVPT